MPVKRRIAKTRQPDISETALWRLSDGLFPEPEDGLDRWEMHLASKASDEKLWSPIRKEIIEAWIQEHPCTRPRAWWDFEAPEPMRMRLRGIGTPWCMAIGCDPLSEEMVLGIPERFLDEWPPYGDAETRDHRYPPLDPTDPPQYESQAAFLQRHGLLTASERRHLAAHPELLEPETVRPEEEEETNA